VYIVATEALKCPRDGNTLMLIYESEKLVNGVTRVAIYYKCSTCSYRRDVERLEISRAGDGISIKRILYSH